MLPVKFFQRQQVKGVAAEVGAKGYTGESLVGGGLLVLHQHRVPRGVHVLVVGEQVQLIREIGRILAACGASPRATLVLALSGQEELACEWMRSEIGEFLEELFSALPAQLERTLGRRIEDVRPRWANGTSQLVARMLAKHIDDFANRDIAMALSR